jgi:hypothetical protein
MRNYPFRFLARLATATAIAFALTLVYTGFTRDADGPVTYAVSALGLALGIVNWVLAVYIWSLNRGGREELRVLVLFFLVPLGFLWGWAYILARAWRIDPEQIPRHPEGA